MKVTVQIPALNEGKSIAQTVARIPRDCVDEILVIDGHSKDNTVEAAKAAGMNQGLLTRAEKAKGAAGVETLHREMLERGPVIDGKVKPPTALG